MSQCTHVPVRSGYGMELSQPTKSERGDVWLCDLELVNCGRCGHGWVEVVKECAEWAKASRREGRTLPYWFGDADGKALPCP